MTKSIFVLFFLSTSLLAMDNMVMLNFPNKGDTEDILSVKLNHSPRGYCKDNFIYRRSYVDNNRIYDDISTYENQNYEYEIYSRVNKQEKKSIQVCREKSSDDVRYFGYSFKKNKLLENGFERKKLDSNQAKFYFDKIKQSYTKYRNEYLSSH